LSPRSICLPVTPRAAASSQSSPSRALQTSPPRGHLDDPDRTTSLDSRSEQPSGVSARSNRRVSPARSSCVSPCTSAHITVVLQLRPVPKDATRTTDTANDAGEGAHSVRHLADVVGRLVGRNRTSSILGTSRCFGHSTRPASRQPRDAAADHPRGLPVADAAHEGRAPRLPYDAQLRRPRYRVRARRPARSGPSSALGSRPPPHLRRTADRSPMKRWPFRTRTHPQVPHRNGTPRGSSSFVLGVPALHRRFMRAGLEPEGPSPCPNPRRARLAPACSEEQRGWSVFSVRRLSATERRSDYVNGPKPGDARWLVPFSSACADDRCTRIETTRSKGMLRSSQA